MILIDVDLSKVNLRGPNVLNPSTAKVKFWRFVPCLKAKVLPFHVSPQVSDKVTNKSRKLLEIQLVVGQKVLKRN